MYTFSRHKIKVGNTLKNDFITHITTINKILPGSGDFISTLNQYDIHDIKLNLKLTA